MLKKLKLKWRLIVSYLLILIMSIVTVFVALTGLQRSNQALRDFVNHPFQADTAIKMCRIETNIAARTIREMLIDPNSSNAPAYRANVESNVAALHDNIAKFKAAYTGTDGLAEKYEAALNNWVAIGENIMVEIEKGNDTVAGEMLLNQCIPALNNLVSIAQEINTKTDQMQADALAQNFRYSNIASLTVIGMLVLMVILCFWIASVVTKSIAIPVKQVRLAAEGLSAGILETEIPYTGTDELGEMAESMRQSMKTLSIYIHDIDVSLATMAKGDFNIATSQPFVGDFVNIERSFVSFSKTMSDTLRQIQSASDQIAMSAQQVSGGAQALSQGATEQASSIEELSSTITQMSDQINTSSDHAQTANAYADKAGEGVVAGNQKMTETIQAMAEISDKSRQIGNIIKTIEDIAFQTNILALNAAVEAARAGAAGKGFAVVADEVRNLASKSAEAAKNTTALIEGTAAAVDKGAKIADQTAQSLLSVVSDTQKATEMMMGIAQQSKIQAEGADQIKQGIDQIAGVVQTNSATAEESAAASEELSGQAQMMKSLVSRFALRNDTEGNLLAPERPAQTVSYASPAMKQIDNTSFTKSLHDY